LNGCVDAMDDAGFEALYDRYHRNLLAFCRHMLGSREEAEDVLQHTFLAAYRSMPDGDDVRVKPWLYAVARNRCLSLLRARRDAVALDEGLVASEGLVAEVDRRDDLRALVRDVQRLPREQREALLLFELGDSSHDEIATILGVRKAKVKALVFQARETLMGWRAARETPCAEVREQLATLRGSALRRASIRRHVEQCAGCAQYETEVHRQRAALAVALPVVPGAGLKAAVLASALGGSGAAVGAGVATSGALGVGAKGLVAKVLVVAAVAGGAGTGGYVAVEELQQDRGARPAREEQATRPVRATPVALDTSTPALRAPAATTTGAAAKPASPAAKPKAKRARGRALGTKAEHGKAAAPGQLKQPGSPAQGKALGHDKQDKTAPATRKRSRGITAATKRVHKATKKAHKAPKPKPTAAKAPTSTPSPSGQGAGKHAASGKP
jgi:RNA polymerase sigma factor (sigma-70 family)